MTPIEEKLANFCAILYLVCGAFVGATGIGLIIHAIIDVHLWYFIDGLMMVCFAVFTGVYLYDTDIRK